MKQASVLIVDNEEDQREILQRLLSMLGYAVVTTDDPEAALRILQESPIPLVITDLIMPGTDGTELCEKIKSLYPQTLVFAWSGYLDLFDESRLKRCGFDGHLNKPIEYRTLADEIARAFRKIGGRSR